MTDEKPFEVSGQMLKELSQTLLEMKKMARSLENAALSIEPLANGETASTLAAIGNNASALDRMVTGIYRLIAREAAQL